ncbi:hypothetical protein AAFF_G00079400 [Aldrovandia affinis]|uniref:Uncharacterized protein n=1 Tax=Aldrovandia affinis TaxID=143900 RepID=A0AAD7RXK2_9TELE|nr:hypothetical protein AAFF_G00079400 [Aldrovandia affinis]
MQVEYLCTKTRKIISVWSVINLIVVRPEFGKIYTSRRNMQQAISAERELLNHLRTYIEDETLQLHNIKSSPSLLLQPMRREVVSLWPYVVLYHSFITGDKAENIRDLAQPGGPWDASSTS